MDFITENEKQEEGRKRAFLSNTSMNAKRVGGVEKKDQKKDYFSIMMLNLVVGRNNDGVEAHGRHNSKTFHSSSWDFPSVCGLSEKRRKKPLSKLAASESNLF